MARETHDHLGGMLATFLGQSRTRPTSQNYCSPLSATHQPLPSKRVPALGQYLVSPIEAAGYRRSESGTHRQR
jgi:hypothetical protein